MPEGPEIRIMSNFINRSVGGEIFEKAFHVEKGNVPKLFVEIENFYLNSDFNGKELLLYLNNGSAINISVFMGMSGNWKWVPTESWSETKFVRFRMDSKSGKSLILHGGYMGPKYKINGFSGVKRGPDIVKEFDKFKDNVLNNITNKIFEKPICEVLLNQKYFNGVGAYLCAEIVGRLNIDPFRNLKSLNLSELNDLFNMILRCINESYEHGGGELKDWSNPFGVNNINDWILYYGNKKECVKQKFGNRNIWINKKFITSSKSVSL